MENRIKSIELLRFIFSIMVVVVHFVEFFGFQNEHFSNVMSVGIEFFFILSGFLMMMHIEKGNNDESCFSFIIHKAKGFFFPLTIVNIIHFIVVCIINNINTINGVLEKLWHFKWEFLMLQCAGFIKDPQFDQDYLIGSTWYISAMMIALFFAFYFAKNHKEIFTKFICPLSVLSIYVYITQTYNNINIGSGFVGPICTAVIRAFAGICIGVISYEAYKYLKNKDISKSKIFALLDIIAWLSLPFLVIYGLYGQDDNSIFFTIFFAMLIIFAFTDQTPISRFFNRFSPDSLNLLGKMSLYFYLTHWTVVICTLNFGSNLSLSTKGIVVVGCTLIYSAILFIIDSYRKKVFK